MFFGKKITALGAESGMPNTVSSGATLFLNARLIDKNYDSLGALLIAHGIIIEIFTGPDAERRAREKAQTITSLLPKDQEVSIVDVQGLVLAPSFIDLHAHFREPGFTQKEDLESASKAACAGGYGTVVLMANTNPVISTQKAAQAVCQRILDLGLIQAFQSVSLTENLEGKSIELLNSIDAHLVPLATEDGKEVASSELMLKAMEILASKGVVVSCHCEDPSLIDAAKHFRNLALTKPETKIENLAKAEKLLALAENIMTERNLLLAEKAECHLHIAHISTQKALDAVRRYKQADHISFKLSCEATPHHLCLNDTNPAIVNPPLRPETDRKALIKGIQDGTIDAIATDHAPHTDLDKQKGAPGFSGIQTAFAACNTYLVQEKHISLSKLSELMSANPAQILHLNKGQLCPNMDADLVIIDPSACNPYTPNQAHTWFSKSTNTAPYTKELVGKILAVYKKGQKVFQN